MANSDVKDSKSFKVGDKVNIVYWGFIFQNSYNNFAKTHNLTKHDTSFDYPHENSSYGTCEVVALQKYMDSYILGIYCPNFDIDIIIYSQGVEHSKRSSEVIVGNTICRHCGRPAIDMLFSVFCDCEANKRGEL